MEEQGAFCKQGSEHKNLITMSQPTLYKVMNGLSYSVTVFGSSGTTLYVRSGSRMDWGPSR
jgi:hypothetical protein